jgi:hypothetical protein
MYNDLGFPALKDFIIIWLSIILPIKGQTKQKKPQKTKNMSNTPPKTRG